MNLLIRMWLSWNKQIIIFAQSLLFDYAMNTPEDSFTTGGSVKTRIELIRNNQNPARKK